MARSARQPEQAGQEETLAQAVRRVSAGVRRLRESGLNDRGVIVLLSDATGVPKTTIRKVIDGLAELEERYTR